LGQIVAHKSTKRLKKGRVMPARLLRFIGMGLGAAMLGGCLQAPPPPAKEPVLTIPAETLYVGRSDNGFEIPAIPVEAIAEPYRRQVVDFASDEVPGTIIINPAARHLHFITGEGKAIRYGIAVGKAGFEWAGVAQITDRKLWPTWTPPPEMIARKPELVQWEKGQPGGPTNPLGARALYLTTNGIDYGYRIHGTPEWQSIGSNASSGCIRMINQDVIDLFGRALDGSKVVVLNADGTYPATLKLPPKPVLPKREAKAAAPVAQVPVAPVAIPDPLDHSGPI
jgi:lipoprotein-anchoring transpeptidase ErfK/SrfK